jgi:hypothetical protein
MSNFTFIQSHRKIDGQAEPSRSGRRIQHQP